MIKATEHQINVRACLHRGGGPQVGEVTHLGITIHVVSHVYKLLSLPDRVPLSAGVKF